MEGADTGSHVQSCVRLILGYRRLVALATAVCALAAAAYAFTVAPVYRAEAIIAHAYDDLRLSVLGYQLSGGAVGRTYLTAGASQQIALAVLSSQTLISEFVTRHGLLRTPLAEEGEHLAHVIERFSEDVLRVQESPRNGLITVSIKWTDPGVAADWANAYVALANQLIQQRVLDETNRNLAYLRQQVTQTPVVSLERTLYSLLETETMNGMMARARADFAFRIVDSAIAPVRPVFPRRGWIVVGGLLMGACAGLCVAAAHRALQAARQTIAVGVRRSAA